MLEFVVREGRIVIYYRQISMLLHSRGHVFFFFFGFLLSVATNVFAIKFGAL